MSRYVDIDQIIADIYKKWGCDPAYYVGVSGADAHEAKLDADLIEFLQSKPSIDIVRCKDCEYGEQDAEGRWFCRGLGAQIGDEDGNGFCADGERKEKSQ